MSYRTDGADKRPDLLLAEVEDRHRSLILYAERTRHKADTLAEENGGPYHYTDALYQAANDAEAEAAALRPDMEKAANVVADSRVTRRPVRDVPVQRRAARRDA